MTNEFVIFLLDIKATWLIFSNISMILEYSLGKFTKRKSIICPDIVTEEIEKCLNIRILINSSSGEFNTILSTDLIREDKSGKVKFLLLSDEVSKRYFCFSLIILNI